MAAYGLPARTGEPDKGHVDARLVTRRRVKHVDVGLVVGAGLMALRLAPSVQAGHVDAGFVMCARPRATSEHPERRVDTSTRALSAGEPRRGASTWPSFGPPGRARSLSVLTIWAASMWRASSLPRSLSEKPTVEGGPGG
jgi:hypothetical protein